MGLLYSAPFENVSITNAAQDIVFLATSSSVPLLLHSIRVTAARTTDTRARIQLLRRTTAGSGGTGITPNATFGRNSVAAAVTATYARTTVGTAGTILLGEVWSLLVPFEWTPTPEMRVHVPVSGFIGLLLVAGTGVTETMSGEVVFEEM